MFQVPHVYPSNVYDWKHFCQTSTGEYLCILAQGFVRKLGLLTVGQESQRLPVVSIRQSLKLLLGIVPQNSPGIKVQFAPHCLPCLTCPHSLFSFESCLYFHQSLDSVSASGKPKQTQGSKGVVLEGGSLGRSHLACGPGHVSHTDSLSGLYL